MIYVAVTRTEKSIFLYISDRELVFLKIPKIPKKKLSKRYVINNIFNGSIYVDSISLTLTPVIIDKIFNANSFLFTIEHYFEVGEKLIYLYKI